jgi:dihydropteroate synthase
MRDFAVYDTPGGVVEAVRDELAERVAAIRDAGIPDERIVLDPGLGFAKNGAQNWELLRGVDRVADLGFPLLVGASRKSFLGHLLADRDGSPRPVDDREAASLALTLLLAQQGVWGIRVHDVRASRDVLRVLDQMRSDGGFQ